MNEVISIPEIKISLNQNTLEKVSAGLVYRDIGFYWASNYWCSYCEKFDDRKDAIKFDKNMNEACMKYKFKNKRWPIAESIFFEKPEDYLQLPC